MWALDLVDLSSLHTTTCGDPRVAIGLVDGPVAADTATFQGARVCRPTVTHPCESSTCTTPRSAACGHGTFVAALLVGRGTPLPAIAPNCTLIVHSIFREDEHPGPHAAELADAITACIREGARIINLSVALVGAGEPRAMQRLGNVLDDALARGVLVVAAAGNRGVVGSTALTRHPGVIPVVACDRDGRVADGADLGRTIGERGLRAPGVDVPGIAPDGSPRSMSGSSVAVPFVSGAAALLWSAFPDATSTEIRDALVGSRRTPNLIPPLLDAGRARALLSRKRSIVMNPPDTHEAPPTLSAVQPAGTAPSEGCTCSTRGGAPGPAAAAAPSWVYAIGRVEPRFPSIALEKEYAQVVARAGDAGGTDEEKLVATIGDAENRYLARQLCWVFSIEGLPTYILKARDQGDVDRLVGALRTSKRGSDTDVVIGSRGPIAPPEICGGLQLPIVAIDHIYSFDVEALIAAIPRAPEVDEREFCTSATALFQRIQQLADNAGMLDEHRAMNYLAVRYADVYRQTAAAFAKNQSLTSVETHASRLSGVDAS